MKKLLVILILCSVMVTAGCSMSNRPTLVDSALERDFRIGQIDDFQMRMFVDDWDRIWLRNRNSDLSYWTARVGY
jgi:hypothetical protein